MNTIATSATGALSRRYLLDFPQQAARELERLDPAIAAATLAEEPASVLAGAWNRLTPTAADVLLPLLPETLAAHLLRDMEPGHAASMLMRCTPERAEALLAAMGREAAEDLRRMMAYPPDSAGALMNANVAAFRGETTAGEALERLRTTRPKGLRAVYLLDETQRLVAAVDIQDLALAEAEVPLSSLAHPVDISVAATAPRDEINQLLERRRIEELPVIDLDGHLLGVIRATELLYALQEASSTDMQAMVGVSREERALSPVTFAMRKRLLWIHVNLLTAFMAASVVGLFENIIAQFTALAILMPVVAGMSGNTGAQALAVTLRGLALHEIGTRHWLRIMFKELRVGFFNGIAIATTTAIAVWLWSGNEGLSLVIALSMIMSMSIACVAGAMVPIILTRLRQDPAQSSAIFITTVTDIAGFFSFLGIASLLAPMLMAG